jgi:hypothetical protein
VVAHELLERVAAELAGGLVGEHQRGHGLGDDARRGHRGDVGALLEGDRLLLGGGVDGLQHRAVERGQRLHRHPRDQQPTGGHATFGTARERGPAGVLARVVVPEDLVVGFAAAPPRDLEAVADLHALHGLDAHERLREQAVELAVPVDVRPEACGHAVAEHLDHAAEGVADLRRGLDLGDHQGLGRGIEAADRGVVDHGQVGGCGAAAGRGSGRAHLDDVAHDLGADLGEERLRQGAGRDAGRGLAGARPFEHVAGVVEAVLLHADEVGVARAGLMERLLGRARCRRHLFLPLRPLGVVDHDRDRRPEGDPVADAAEELDVVALEAHAGTAAEPEAAPRQLVADLLDGDGQARGQALDDHREGGAV